MAERTLYVASIPCAAGNGAVGTTWQSCLCVTPETTVAEIMEWRADVKTGRNVKHGQPHSTGDVSIAPLKGGSDG